MRIAFEPDVPVAAFMPPPASCTNGHVRTRIRRDGMNRRETPGETTYEHLSIPDKASCGYSQDSCSELFSKSSEFDSTETRSIHRLREKLPDDPDEVLSALKMYPEVVLHGDRLYSMNNRRTHCLKNCAAPKAARIWVRLYHSPHDYDKFYGYGAFDRYYRTTSGGGHVTVTQHHHKGNSQSK